jgi:antitoxin VapB
MYKESVMAIHVQDKEADRLLRDFAKRRGVGITEAIKVAVRDAEKSEKESVEGMRRRIEPILAQIRAARNGAPFSMEDDKAFMDEMWGETD